MSNRDVGNAGNATNAAQQFFDDAVTEAENAEKKYKQSANARWWLAIGLKAIALSAGIVVVTALINQTLLGFIIAVAVILDQLLSNHRRLITETIAANAVGRTIRKVKNNYQHLIVDVIDAKDHGRIKEAQKLLIDLAKSSAKTIRDELDRIHTAVENANIEFLSSLNIDQPAQTALPTAGKSPQVNASGSPAV